MFKRTYIHLINTRYGKAACSNNKLDRKDIRYLILTDDVSLLEETDPPDGAIADDEGLIHNAESSSVPGGIIIHGLCHTINNLWLTIPTLNSTLYGTILIKFLF